MRNGTSSRLKRPIRITEWILLALIIAGLGGVDVTFYFWPFRYRQVHPLLESVFHSKVVVTRYHRTYFPHPGFIAEGVTFYRHGATSVPLATIGRMSVVGTWSGLVLHPHSLYQMRLDGLHVQIPIASDGSSGASFDGVALSTTQMKLNIETIAADGTVLDFLRPGRPNLRISLPALQVHDVRANHPLQFFVRSVIPGLQGTVAADGSLGPLQSGNYSATPLSGRYQLSGADLSRVSHLEGHVEGGGRFSGKVSSVDVQGVATIPDFRAGDAHRERLDTSYEVTVQEPKGQVQIRSATVRTGDSTIHAEGLVAGTPKKAVIAVSTSNSRLDQMLDLIEKREPSAAGYVSFQAQAQFEPGPEPFLKRLELQGQVSIRQVHFIDGHDRTAMDSFSARVRKPTPQEPDPDHGGDDVAVTAAASSHTSFHDGVATFPDIHVMLPGAQAQLHGTFNLLDLGVHLTGNAMLQRNVSHAVTGWKSVVLKPLAPFFRHRNAGAVVPIAVTGTGTDPKIQGNLLHDK